MDWSDENGRIIGRADLFVKWEAKENAESIFMLFEAKKEKPLDP
jgi:hypothetical protein